MVRVELCWRHRRTVKLRLDDSPCRYRLEHTFKCLEKCSRLSIDPVSGQSNGFGMQGEPNFTADRIRFDSTNLQNDRFAYFRKSREMRATLIENDLARLNR